MSLAKNPPRIGSKCVDMLNPETIGEVVSAGKIVRLKSEDGKFFRVPIERIQASRRKVGSKNAADPISAEKAEKLIASACDQAKITIKKLRQLAESNGLSIEQAADAILE